MTGLLPPETISTKQERIATLARQMPDTALRSLSCHLDLEWLVYAFDTTRHDGAVGVDGVTANEYVGALEERLMRLLDATKSGSYRAPPVRRTYIPKDGGKLRPLGIPTFEDKVLQQAYRLLLEPLYEQVFHDCSYGFRPGRSAHQALERVRDHLVHMGGGWVLDVDIRAFFDSVDHSVLRGLIQKRVCDGVVIRAIGKWLNAGVLEDGAVTRSGRGTPQGGVISPLLANIYLHYVVDEWFHTEVLPRLRGRAHLVRYADDFVMVFSNESDARRVAEVLPKRLARFALEVSPEKTRLVYFKPSKRNDGTPPGTFNFLGFTLYWGKSRKGRPTVRWKTMAKRIARTLRAFNVLCRAHRHDPIPYQHRLLSWRLRGHYQYFGLTMNYQALNRVAHAVTRIWQKWLSRRSQKGMSWRDFKKLLKRFPLPTPRVVQSVYRHA